MIGTIPGHIIMQKGLSPKLHRAIYMEHGHILAYTNSPSRIGAFGVLESYRVNTKRASTVYRQCLVRDKKAR